MKEQLAIEIRGLKKRYRLGQIGRGTLNADLQSLWARLRGKEDPNSKLYQRKRLTGDSLMALDGIDLQVKKGEALGIIGGNGAGKSTMLKILSRITAPTEGSVDIYGRISSMLEVGTGFNAQMTGRENVYMNGAILGMTKAEIDTKMEAIIDFSEVREFIDTPVKRYSSGMYVKLAFAVAAHLDAEIMIMDEVLAVGDAAFQKKCLDRMRTAATSEGKTVLYVSHNMHTIRSLCDRCIVLEQGRIIFDGDVEEAIRVYTASNARDTGVDIDLSAMERPWLPVPARVRMTRLQLTGKQYAVYGAGEEIPFLLTLRAVEATPGLQLRLQLYFSDDTPVGTAQSVCLGDLAAGEDKTYALTFRPEGITGGRYKCLLALNGQKDFGRSYDYDAVGSAVCFDVVEDAAGSWNPNRWGHIRFPDIQLKDKE